MAGDTGVQYETKLTAVDNLNNDGKFDGVIFVGAPGQHKEIPQIGDAIEGILKIDEALQKADNISVIPNEKFKRLVYVPTGAIDADYDDVRVFRKAANKGIQRAFKAGIEKPLVVLVDHPKFKSASLVTILGILERLYMPIQLREHDPKKIHKITEVGVYTKTPSKTKELVDLASKLESGRRVACDIGDADPERMSPVNVEEYVRKLFANSSISVNVIKDLSQISKEYPLFEAVNRAASVVERHQGRIIFLEYNPSEKVEKTVFLVGKGVTYDTGGCDIKAGGIMAGMSRDKCGAAAVTGFFQAVNLLKPKNLRVVGALSVVRNSVGSNAYVSDELIKARSGALVRVGNTDAEGRMVMADVLCRMKELALDAVNPHLYTIATLTGHAVLTVGKEYSIVMDNGPARKTQHAESIREKGEQISDPFEVSVIRREDLAHHKGRALGDDIVQCVSTGGSGRTHRGHQGPGAFLILSSGLDKHGSESEKPLKYSHIDIAGSAGELPEPATGAPVYALANAYLLN